MVARTEKQGVSVTCPIFSIDKKNLEEVDGHYIFVFEKAPGRPADSQEMTSEFFRDLGRNLGKIHRVSQGFDTTRKRHDWQDQFDAMIDGYDEDQALLDTILSCMDEFLKFPQSWEEYGLVHSDFRMENFLVHQGRMTFFDFEDCCYHWFAYDVAVASCTAAMKYR